jgi:trehalose-phosphatase
VSKKARKYCFHHWDEIVQRIRAKDGLFVALDFDGVLSPIASRPSLARMPPKNRRLLKALSCHEGVFVAIVSGRTLADIRHKIHLPRLIYAGNHGAEIALDGALEQHIPLERYRLELVAARSALMPIAAAFPGAHLEDKGFGIGLHYREVARPLVPKLKRQFKRFVRTLPKDLKIAPAKMMWEVRPNEEWNKGSAVLRIWQDVAPNSLPICLGDDKTDEDGFLALKGKGVNVFVGAKHRESHAEYFLNSVTDVTHFLGRLLTEADRTFKKKECR